MNWYDNTFDIRTTLTPRNILVPAFSYEEFFLDSIGYNKNEKGVELHFLLRSNINFTDGIWVWIASKETTGPLSTKEGDNIGIRQSWNVSKEQLLREETEIELFVGRQNAEHCGWYVHWELNEYVYQIYVRPSMDFDYQKLNKFIHTFKSNENRNNTKE